MHAVAILKEKGMMRNVLIISGLFLCLGVCCLGRTITVALDGSGEFSTIQGAADAAADGDIIILADGVYSGPGNYRTTVRKSVTIKSTAGVKLALSKALTLTAASPA